MSATFALNFILFPIFSFLSMQRANFVSSLFPWPTFGEACIPGVCAQSIFDTSSGGASSQKVVQHHLLGVRRSTSTSVQYAISSARHQFWRDYGRRKRPLIAHQRQVFVALVVDKLSPLRDTVSSSGISNGELPSTVDVFEQISTCHLY